MLFYILNSVSPRCFCAKYIDDDDDDPSRCESVKADLQFMYDTILYSFTKFRITAKASVNTGPVWLQGCQNSARSVSWPEVAKGVYQKPGRSLFC